MNIDQLIERLQRLHPKIRDKVSCYASFDISSRELIQRELALSNIQTLTLEEAGKAIRYLSPNWKGEVDWSITVYKRILWKRKEPSKLNVIRDTLSFLTNQGISHLLCYDRTLVIHLSSDCYLSSFRTSDDPNVWRDMNKKKVDHFKIRRVMRKLDRE